MSRTKSKDDWLEQIVKAGLSGDKNRLQLTLLSAIRSLKKREPSLSDKLGELLSQHTGSSGALRWKEPTPLPYDTEEGMSLVRVNDNDNTTKPVLTPSIANAIDQFITERNNSSLLLREGYSPPSSLLLMGPPGTGKTMLAWWISAKLELPLVTQDLATSISSLLGKTGFNLRRTMDYARSHPCLLLLDEFDAIAKRRDDSSELGELKRIVNVLLKELENWPSHSVIIAATNHPDLLDPAISRRFHVSLDLPLPEHIQRMEILRQVAGHLFDQIPSEIALACSDILINTSGSDLDRIMQAAIRKHISRNISLEKTLITEVLSWMESSTSKTSLGLLIRALRKATNEKITVRDIAQLTGKSTSTVQYHLKKE